MPSATSPRISRTLMQLWAPGSLQDDAPEQAQPLFNSVRLLGSHSAGNRWLSSRLHFEVRGSDPRIVRRRVPSLRSCSDCKATPQVQRMPDRDAVAKALYPKSPSARAAQSDRCYHSPRLQLQWWPRVCRRRRRCQPKRTAGRTKAGRCGPSGNTATAWL